jgi:two-component system sensor histidine kinase BaeS
MAEALAVQESLRKKLTANVAHELRTPISAVRGELEGMIDGLIPAERENLQSLYAEIGRLRTILDGIEDLSQVEASAMSLEVRELDLKPFLSAIIERYGSIFRDKGVSLRLRCEDALKVDADPDRLSQVMVNLLTNALKATGQGGSVTVEAKRADHEVSISVSDTGAGIRAEDLPFVFERFYRAAEDGLGIGLTIVRELVEAHGGSVKAESELGRGSKFTVLLPF